MKKSVLLILIISTLTLFWYFHLNQYLNLAMIEQYQKAASLWTISHYQYAITIYITSYILLIACGIPCATFFTLIGGFLFGAIAILYSLFSMTIGGLILLMAVRTTFGAKIASRNSGWLKTVEQGFQQNAFHYLLMLRLMPIFPCWISNASAGALNVPVSTFISATFIGLLPSTIIYVLAGRSMDKFLINDHTSMMNLMLTPSISLPLFGLTLLSLFPIIYKCVKKRQ